MNAMQRVRDYLLSAGRTDLAGVLDAVTAGRDMREAELKARIEKAQKQEPEFWYLPAEDDDGEDALLLPCRDGTSPAVGAIPLYTSPVPPAEAKVADADKGTCPACGTDIALTHAVNMLAAKAKGGGE